MIENQINLDGCTVVFSSEMGVGKTSSVTSFTKYVLLTQGRARQNKSCAQIDEINKKRKKPLSKPDKAPIFANYNMEFKTGYKKTYSPYWLNPYYFGQPKQGKKVMPIVPWSFAVFQEMDDVYDSNNKSPLASAVKGMYNKRRHWHIDVIIELHRSMNLAVAIRSVANRFLEVRGKESEKDLAGRTIRTTWTLREFKSWQDVEKYLELSTNEQTKAKLYREFKFTNEGDIFKCYDSEECAEEFIPDENEDFTLLPQKSKVNVKALPPEVAEFYSDIPPADFRGGNKSTTTAQADKPQKSKDKHK